jgi:TRAP-type C4-dicarboxylate transport system substrate-binding protein
MIKTRARITFSLVSVVLLVAFVFVLQATFPASAPAQAKPVTLRMHTHIPNRGVEGAALSKYCEEANRRSGGLITINVFWGGVLGKAGEELEGVQQGRMDMAMTVMSYNPAKLPLGRISRPVLFGDDDSGHISTIVRKLYDEFPEMRNELEKYNHKPLAYGPLPTYNIYSKSPIRTLSDLKGVKIAATGADLPRALSAVGAIPVALPSQERYMAIQTGVISGSLLALETQYRDKIHEVAKNVTITNLGAIYAFAVTINKDTYAKLHPDLQKALLEAGPPFETFFGQEENRTEQGVVDNLKKAGVQVFVMSDADKMAWAQAIPDLPKEWIGEMEKLGLPGRKIMNRYLQLMEEMGHKFPRRWGPY